MSRTAVRTWVQQLVLKLEERVSPAPEAAPTPEEQRAAGPAQAQPPLDFVHLARALQELDRRLGARTPPPVVVRSRRNRHTMASLRLDVAAGVWRLVVAEDLALGHPELMRDLAFLLLHRARRKASPPELLASLARLRTLWARHSQAASVPVKRRVERVEDAVLTHRLMEVSTRLGHLPTQDLPSIVWAKSTSRRVLGRYDSRAHRIEIHIALRHPSVPKVMMDNLIAHELLHALLGPVRRGGRLVHHHAEFRKQERAFPGYPEAEGWTRNSWPRRVARYLKGQT